MEVKIQSADSTRERKLRWDFRMMAEVGLAFNPTGIRSNCHGVSRNAERKTQARMLALLFKSFREFLLRNLAHYRHVGREERNAELFQLPAGRPKERIVGMSGPFA